MPAAQPLAPEAACSGCRPFLAINPLPCLPLPPWVTLGAHPTAPPRPAPPKPLILVFAARLRPLSLTHLHAFHPLPSSQLLSKTPPSSFCPSSQISPPCPQLCPAQPHWPCHDFMQCSAAHCQPIRPKARHGAGPLLFPSGPPLFCAQLLLMFSPVLPRALYRLRASPLPGLMWPAAPGQPAGLAFFPPNLSLPFARRQKQTAPFPTLPCLCQ